MNRLSTRVTSYHHGRNQNSGHGVSRKRRFAVTSPATFLPQTQILTNPEFFVDKYVNKALYLVARSGSAPEMGTISDFDSKATKVREIFERRKNNMATKKKAAKKKKH